MRLLASRFTAARQKLDRAEALPSAQERVPVQQLRSLFGGTLAAAHYGLGDRATGAAVHLRHSPADVRPVCHGAHRPVGGAGRATRRTREGGNQWPAKSTA